MPIKQVKIKTATDIKKSVLESRVSKTPKIQAEVVGEKSESTPSELNGKMLHIKVGVPSWNAQMVEEEVNKVEDKVLELLEKNNIDCLVLVTHYGVDVKLIEPANPKKVSSRR